MLGRCACEQAGIKEAEAREVGDFPQECLELKIQLEEELRGKAQVEGMQQWVALERISTPHDLLPATQVSRLPDIDGHLKYVPSAEQGTRSTLVSFSHQLMQSGGRRSFNELTCALDVSPLVKSHGNVGRRSNA
ncbi:Bifunctional protein FolD [Trichinella spiralis]|uniref:Bifunctional protein FolD n=1 Tax=Trichinella spiralis TaxID=6334 RepID=A0ABR3KG74_TRISP